MMYDVIYKDVLDFTLTNFCFAMFILATFFIFIHKIIMRGKLSDSEIVYRWLALFPLGMGSIYTFIVHAFYPALADPALGYTCTSMQCSIGIAYLAFGVMAVLSFNASFGFRLATVIGNAIWLLGSATTHINAMIIQENYMLGEAGSWLWMQDLILPLLMLICINGLNPNRK